jgi:nitroreductase
VTEEVFEAIMTRRSIRAFMPDDIPEQVLARIITAAIWAPTAGNAQPWYFYAVRDKYLKTKLAESALQQTFLVQAPVVLVVCADLERARAAYGKRGETLYCIQDAAAATQNILLASHSLGLGACWVGAFSEQLVTDLLDLPSFHRPLALVAIGRAGQRVRSPGRRTLDDVFSEID